MTGMTDDINVDRWDKHWCCQQIESLVWPFYWHINIWPWAILKIINVSTKNISRTATDTANIATTNKYRIACDLSIGISTFWQVTCTFRLGITCKRWQMGQTLLLPTNTKSHRPFRWHIYIWPWPTLTVQVMHISIVHISQRMIFRTNITHFQLIGSHMWSFWLAYLYLTVIHSKGRGKTFRLRISRKWWQIGQILLLTQILCHMSAFDCYI